MKIEKTIDEKRDAVLQFCERVCPKQYTEHILQSGCILRGGLREWRFGIPTAPDFCSIYSTLDVGHPYWKMAYTLLGLETADAVAGVKESTVPKDLYEIQCAATELETKIAADYRAKWKAERAKNAKLVEALDEYMGLGYVDFEDLVNIIEPCKEILKAHKEGATND